jgi:hypothetical protein
MNAVIYFKEIAVLPIFLLFGLLHRTKVLLCKKSIF